MCLSRSQSLFFFFSLKPGGGDDCTHHPPPPTLNRGGDVYPYPPPLSTPLTQRFNPNQPGLFWRLSCPGGGAAPAPPQILAAEHAIAAKICIKVECDVNYKTVLLDYTLLLSFILYELIMLIYAKYVIITMNH